jgi:hypothetical protein
VGFVWNILLSFDNEELWEDGEEAPRDICVPVERINQWIPHGKLVDLTGPSYAKATGNGLDVNLFGGGYRRFDIEGFIRVVEAQDWKERAKVQLWVKGAEEGMGDEPFTLVKLRRRSRHPVRVTSPAVSSKARLKTGGKRAKTAARRRPTARSVR